MSQTRRNGGCQSSWFVWLEGSSRKDPLLEPTASFLNDVSMLMPRTPRSPPSCRYSSSAYVGGSSLLVELQGGGGQDAKVMRNGLSQTEHVQPHLLSSASGLQDT